MKAGKGAVDVAPKGMSRYGRDKIRRARLRPAEAAALRSADRALVRLHLTYESEREKELEMRGALVSARPMKEILPLVAAFRTEFRVSRRAESNWYKAHDVIKSQRRAVRDVWNTIERYRWAERRARQDARVARTLAPSQ